MRRLLIVVQLLVAAGVVAQQSEKSQQSEKPATPTARAQQSKKPARPSSVVAQQSEKTTTLTVPSPDGGIQKQSAKPATPTDSMTGVVRKVSVENNGQGATLTIESGKGRIPHQIHCTPATSITTKKTKLSLTQLKEGSTIDCKGTLHQEVLEASACTVR